MDTKTYAQIAILHRINEKAKGGILNEGHWEHIDHNAYVDCCVLNGINTAHQLSQLNSIMKKMTFAQETIWNRITEKEEWFQASSIQCYSDSYSDSGYSDYSDHSDYYDIS